MSPERTVHLDSPTAELHASIGEDVRFTLDATPGAGALWTSGPTADGCTVSAGESTILGSAPGSETRQTFRFCARAPGRYVLAFHYGRPWEQIVRARREVVVVVDAA